MNELVFVGIAIGLLAIMTASLVMTTVNATIENDSTSGSDIGKAVPDENGFIRATEHINEAQSALQNGDTESANNHLELAKQSLHGNHSTVNG